MGFGFGGLAKFIIILTSYLEFHISPGLPQIQLNWGSGPLPPSLELGGGGRGLSWVPANLPQIRRASLAATPKTRFQVVKQQKDATRD